MRTGNRGRDCRCGAVGGRNHVRNRPPVAREMQLMKNEIVYCKCMANIRKRVDLAWSIVNLKITTGQQGFDAELVFVQFRKILELIAFSSLTANKEIYAIARANFSKHWKAKLMLDAVGKLNRNFYPLPLSLPETLPNGVKNMTPLAEDFLTKDDFEFLYDESSEALHERNPFSTTDPLSIYAVAPLSGLLGCSVFLPFTM
jgi:hypothetical protein